jgi:transaldolase/glucose-6-phosphate isomerase
MGVDLKDFLARAAQMVEVCKTPNPGENAGALLGSILGVCHRQGRDKLTIFTSPEIYDLGAWLEQLIAESTGKSGVAIIPVDRERIQPAETYGDDRVFVYLKLDGAHENELADSVDELERNGQPVIRINLPEVMNLGQEFFRWEFATAVAGAVMGINPFDQPDVESAKIEARKITEEYEQTGALPAEAAFYEESGIKLFTDEKNAARLNESLEGEKSLSAYLRAHFERIGKNDYFALLAYIEMNAENENALQSIRHSVLRQKRAATCLGFGPRFLHSTGQAYKGGANNGVFLQITSENARDFPVPEQKYTFGVVCAAQARGDFQVLLDRDRRALRVHLGADPAAGLEALRQAVDEAFSQKEE